MQNAKFKLEWAEVLGILLSKISDHFEILVVNTNI
jgi:hypothetical protein